MKKVLDHVGGEDVEETKGDFAYAGHHKFCVLFRKCDPVYRLRGHGVLTQRAVKPRPSGRGYKAHLNWNFCL